MPRWPRRATASRGSRSRPISAGCEPLPHLRVPNTALFGPSVTQERVGRASSGVPAGVGVGRSCRGHDAHQDRPGRHPSTPAITEISPPSGSLAAVGQVFVLARRTFKGAGLGRTVVATRNAQMDVTVYPPWP
jgi:hypothetical protein